jgi:hypothetical protein
MLPRIDSPKGGVGAIQREFLVSSDSIGDLFYDGLTDPTSELRKLHSVLAANRQQLEEFYTGGIGGIMNRQQFCEFVAISSGIDREPANEVFSCSTNLYAAEGELGVGADCSMSRTQFATGVVRLANLVSMMNDGMVDISKLATQTESFLDEIKARRK